MMMGEAWVNYTARLIFVCLVVFVAGTARAQLNTEKTAYNRLQSGKWERSWRILQKSLRKDTSNLEANYVLAHWFLSPGNPEFQVDSSFLYAKKANVRYQQLSIRDKERVEKFPIDSVILQVLHDRIDSTAFERAKRINTEESYNQFIEQFSRAPQYNNAIELRDEVSFLEALKINTYQSFYDYFIQYPESHRAAEARNRHDKLLFEEKTRDKRLSSYKQFLQNYPSSPYASVTQKEIFERMTATGEPEEYFEYLNEYPQGIYTKLTKDILFHLFDETDEDPPTSIRSDSINNVIKLSAQFWVPFYKNGLFGLMDQEGQEVLAPQFEEIDADYKCGPIKDDILSFKSGIYSRSGRKLADSGTQVTHIGFGFVQAERNGCRQLIHKSGARIVSSCNDEYKIIGSNFIAAHSGEIWKLYTLTGRALEIDDVYDVREIEGVIVITRKGKKILTTVSRLADCVNGNELNDELVFDDVLALDKDLLWVRNGSLEGVINNQLQFTIPLDRHSLTKTSFGLIEKSTAGSVVRGLAVDLEDHIWHQVIYHRDWLVLSAEGSLRLYNISTKKMLVTKADSIWFDRSLAFVQSDNTLKVYASASRSFELAPDSKIQFVSARDSVQFFFTKSKNKRTVFNLTSGDLLFTTDFELIESLGIDYFIVSKGNKKGVISRTGKVIVPVEMDAIVLNQAGQLSLLKGKKFGLFDLVSNKLIKPEYERNVTLLNPNYLIAYKDGFYGLIGWNTKPVTEFEFSEIVPWSDSEIWVKKNRQWVLMNFLTQEEIVNRVRDFTWLRKASQESIAVIHQENYYGVISNRKGLIIPSTFNEIINLGTLESPFYFTVKNVEEAEIYVVLYYNKDGKLVRRQAYEEDEFERIYCDSN
jgi:hypothetical protein